MHSLKFLVSTSRLSNVTQCHHLVVHLEKLLLLQLSSVYVCALRTSSRLVRNHFAATWHPTMCFVVDNIDRFPPIFTWNLISHSIWEIANNASHLTFLQNNRYVALANENEGDLRAKKLESCIENKRYAGFPQPQRLCCHGRLYFVQIRYFLPKFAHTSFTKKVNNRNETLKPWRN